MRGLFIVALFSLSACYLSHEPVDELACGLPAPGNPCGLIVTTIPDGLCRLEDGTALVFSDGDRRLGSCAPRSDEPTVLAVDVAGCIEVPLGRHSAFCEDAAPAGALVVRNDRGTEMRFDPARGGCAFAGGRGPAEPFRPPEEPLQQICFDDLSWCGAPFVFEVVLGSDPCNGARFVQRCDARVEGSRIVTEVWTARSDSPICQPALGTRSARCAVPPLAPGDYTITDATGRTLAEVTLRAEPPSATGTQSCFPL